MRRVIALVLTLAFVAAPTGLAMAQAEEGDDEGQPRVVYPKKTEIDFLDEREIEGVLKGPGIVDIFEPAEPVFTPLVKLRGHFNPEMLQSVNEL